MLFSRTCEYGLSAMIYVAKNSENDHPVRIREIAEALDTPFPTVAKVVQKLAREGLLSSQKGPGGGITLARPAAELTVLEVVEALEGRDLGSECILGLAGCSERGLHCALHDQWKGLREGLVKMLADRSLAMVAEGMTEADFPREKANRAKPRGSRAVRTRPQSNERRSAGE